MPHNQNIITGHHIFPQRLCLYAGLYAGILGSHLPLAAIIGNAAAVLDNRLVAAPCKSLINGDPGIIIALAVAFPADTKADTQSSRNRISHIYRLHILKKRETILL